MTEQQFEGRSVAEAAIKACEALGVTRSALKYRVVSETGELLDRRVVIAVTGSQASSPAPAVGLPQDVDDPPPPRRDREATSPREARGERGNRGERGERGGRSARRGGERGERSGRGERSARGRGPRNGGRGGSGGGQQHSDDGIEALLQLDGGPVAVTKRPAIEAQSVRAKRAMGIVADLTRLTGLQLAGELVVDNESEMHIDLCGTDESRIIGKKGEVLLALQFIVNRLLSRGEEEGEQVVVLDAGGYRERRRHALQELAKRLASRAIAEGKAVRLSPMSAHDRRVFHLTLKEIEGVATRSEGEGLYRNLLIIPAEFA